MLFIPFLAGVKYALPFGLATTYGLVFSLFAFSLMYWQNSPFINKAVQWTGKISYSAYFVHFAVLHILPTLHPTGMPSADFEITYAGVVLATVGISSITYRMIEKPMIRFGNAIVAARRYPVIDEVLPDVRPKEAAQAPKALTSAREPQGFRDESISVARRS